MKKWIALSLILLMMLNGCSSQNTQPSEDTHNNNNGSMTNSSDNQTIDVPNTKELFAMDTYMTLKVYGDNSSKVLDQCEMEIKNLESIFNVNDTDSDIYHINSRSGSVVQVDQNTAAVIEKATDMSEKTDGALDISIYPVLREWGFTTGEYSVPDEKTLQNLLQFVDYHNINVNGVNVNIPEAYAIDFGSIAKGYASDQLVSILNENGISSALLNLGGNVYALGTKPSGEKWTVGIQDPTNSTDNICIVKVSDRAVITSGNYERFFERDGKKYWHIIDPKTGFPADNGIISATVIGKNGAECDALSTALFVMGTDKAIKYCQQHRDIDAILVTKDKKVYLTDGISDSAEVSDGIEYSTIARN